jgi:NAD(P)H-hydrate repair Nnr-like enzyme with NAD(P)H-hydrate dehydratase domain
LLAQGYDPLRAARTASLSHAAAARRVCRDKADWALTPEDLISAVARL